MRLLWLVASVLTIAGAAQAATLQAAPASWDGVLAVHVDGAATAQLQVAGQTIVAGADGWAQLQLPDGRHTYTVTVTTLDNSTQVLAGHVYVRNLLAPLTAALAALQGPMAGIQANSSLAAEEAAAAAQGILALDIPELPADYARSQDVQDGLAAQAAATNNLEGRVGGQGGLIGGFTVALVVFGLAVIALVVRNVQLQRMTQAAKIELVAVGLALGVRAEDRAAAAVLLGDEPPKRVDVGPGLVVAGEEVVHV